MGRTKGSDGWASFIPTAVGTTEGLATVWPRTERDVRSGIAIRDLNLLRTAGWRDKAPGRTMPISAGRETALIEPNVCALSLRNSSGHGLGFGADASAPEALLGALLLSSDRVAGCEKHADDNHAGPHAGLGTGKGEGREREGAGRGSWEGARRVRILGIQQPDQSRSGMSDVDVRDGRRRYRALC